MNIIRVAIFSAMTFFLIFGYNGFASEDSKVGSIEIISDGRKYESFELYKEAGYQKGGKAVDSESAYETDKPSDNLIQALLMDLQKDKKLNFNFLLGFPLTWPVDVDKFPILPKGEKGIGSQLSEEKNKMHDPFLQSYTAISRVGFNTGVLKVIEDFQKEKWPNYSYKHLRINDLEYALRNSLAEGSYTGPVLIISNKKKLRIMTLQNQE